MMKRLLAVAVLALSALPALAKEVLPFIENDFAKAVAQAKTKKEPIFVDAWAPW
jgi:hypothetical protein